jgi:hypothetical protein
MNLARPRPGPGLARASARAARAFDRRRVVPGHDPPCQSKVRLIYRKRERGSPETTRTMSAMKSWFLTVIAVLGLVLVLHHLGVDVTGTISSAVHGAFQVLGRPLVTF